MEFIVVQRAIWFPEDINPEVLFDHREVLLERVTGLDVVLVIFRFEVAVKIQRACIRVNRPRINIPHAPLGDAYDNPPLIFLYGDWQGHVV